MGEAAELLGVSTDTVRRWIDGGRLAAARDEHGHRVIAGADLAAFARSQSTDPDERSEHSSARNRLRGIVTNIVKDTVMAQVELAKIRRSPYLDYPQEVHIETLALCNAKCSFCPYPTMDRQGDRMPDELIDKIQAQVREAQSEGLRATAEIVTDGAPAAAHVITEAAREHDADIIVVGTRGHGRIAGLLVGSVTQRLLHLAPCPVLAVPSGKHAETREPELVGTEGGVQ